MGCGRQSCSSYKIGITRFSHSQSPYPTCATDNGVAVVHHTVPPRVTVIAAEQHGNSLLEELKAEIVDAQPELDDPQWHRLEEE